MALALGPGTGLGFEGPGFGVGLESCSDNFWHNSPVMLYSL